MPRKLCINVNESPDEIDSILENTGEREKFLKRANLLALLKANTYDYSSDLAVELNVERRTISRWIKIYEECGIDQLFQRYNGSNAKRKITPEMEESIKTYCDLKQNENFGNKKGLSCSDVQQYVHEEFNIKIKYHTIYRLVKKIEMEMMGHIEK